MTQAQTLTELAEEVSAALEAKDMGRAHRAGRYVEVLYRGHGRYSHRFYASTLDRREAEHYLWLLTDGEEDRPHHEAFRDSPVPKEHTEPLGMALVKDYGWKLFPVSRITSARMYRHGSGYPEWVDKAKVKKFPATEEDVERAEAVDREWHRRRMEASRWRAEALGRVVQGEDPFNDGC